MSQSARHNPERRRAHAVRAVAAGTAWAGSLLGAAEYLVVTSWSGARDLVGMAGWSLPFAGVIYLTAYFAADRLRRTPAGWTYIGATLLGPALGLLSFGVAAVLVNGWAVSFPVYIAWAFGGALGLIAAVLVGRPRSWRLGLAAIGVAIMLVVWANARTSAMQIRAAGKPADSSVLATRRSR